ncbi:hypothetical protein CW701_02525 [Candidatus Bathyarchaeota archaeon]|nr:MAG: hypothetical protein CW701_02525 [Candidatus Bathyarchaeota archaeon]
MHEDVKSKPPGIGGSRSRISGRAKNPIHRPRAEEGNKRGVGDDQLMPALRLTDRVYLVGGEAYGLSAQEAATSTSSMEANPWH